MGAKSDTKLSPQGAGRPREILHVWKIGGSLAVTVPYRVARDLSLQPGDQVRVRFSAIEVSAAAPVLVAKQKAELLAKLSPALGWLAEFDGP